MKPTVEEVKLAYKKIKSAHGLYPYCGEWIDLPGGTCCALSAVVIARGAKTPIALSDLEALGEPMNAEIATMLGVQEAFVAGFITGFDDTWSVAGVESTEEYRKAHQLGRQTWKELNF